MHRRFYSPAVGRFLSTNPIAGSPGAPKSWNLYSYTLGNPVKYTDPRGMDISGLFEDVLRFIPYWESIAVTGELDPLQPPHPFHPLTGVQGLGDLIGGRAFLNSLSSGGRLGASKGPKGPSLLKAMAAQLCPQVAEGVTIEATTIQPFTPGRGGSYGWNLEYVPGSGLGLYSFRTPESVKSAGIDLGVSATAIAAIGSGPWSGKFLAAMGSYLYGAVGGFGTPSYQATAQSIGWHGAQIGVGVGLPSGLGETAVVYTPEADLSFLLPWCP